MARILFLAFDAAGPTPQIKALRNAGHKILLSEPRPADAHALLRQQVQPPEAIVCDASRQGGQTREAVAYLRGLQATRNLPLLVYNVKKEDEPVWHARFPDAVLERGDDVLKLLEKSPRRNP